MAPRIIRTILVHGTAPLLILMAAPAPAAADLDVVFVLDTTGSMSGELGEVQDRIRQLATSMVAAREGERLRFGIVAYRDRGDDYVTLPFDLTGDIAAAEVFLSSLRADGGGDGPEAVVAAVAAALWEMSWDRSEGVERQVFLIGDAPPHLDSADDPEPDALVREARRARIVINTVGCRSLPPQGVEFFRSLAYATEGSYQHIGRVEAATPGALTEAMGRSVVESTGPDRGRELDVVWRSHADVETSGLLARQGGPEGVGQARDGDALGACSLEVRLPSGSALRVPPRVWRTGQRLRVELDLTDGPGGRELFTLSECPPTSTPIDITLGGS